MTIYAITVEDKTGIRSWFFLTKEEALSFKIGLKWKLQHDNRIISESTIELGDEYVHTKYGFETPNDIKKREAEFERALNGEDE